VAAAALGLFDLSQCTRYNIGYILRSTCCGQFKRPVFPVLAEWRNGRRYGLKIRWGVTPVRVRLPPRPSLISVFFDIQRLPICDRNNCDNPVTVVVAASVLRIAMSRESRMYQHDVSIGLAKFSTSPSFGRRLSSRETFSSSRSSSVVKHTWPRISGADI
jgi:hypothetical protein